jgi:hypothetical protein
LKGGGSDSKVRLIEVQAILSWFIVRVRLAGGTMLVIDSEKKGELL